MRRLLIVLGFLLLTSPSAHAAYVSPATGSPVAAGVLRAFERPEHNWLPGHRGVDLALEVGSPVFAAGTGVVAFAGVVAGTPTVSVDHADGIRTTYQPVHARVVRGEEVAAGQVIGRLGDSRDDWPGLQWGARTGRDAYLNPLLLLDAPTIRLKPNPCEVQARGCARP